jgi:hypothetical protein
MAACGLDIPVTGHPVVMYRVGRIVGQVEQRIEQANRHGDLAWFNTAFRQWRLRARSIGRGMSYAEARARLRRAMLGGEPELGTAELVAAVFPALPD